jgi:hypothetical protein
MMQTLVKISTLSLPPRRLPGLALAALAALFLCPSAFSDNSSVYFWGFGTPEVDGALAPGEWDRAGQVQFVARAPEGGGSRATLHFMNDSTNLYLALAVERPALDSFTRLFVGFDPDHDGEVETNEDGLLIFVTPTATSFFDGHFSDCPRCAFGNDANHDGQAASGNDGRFTVIEISHPLASSEPLFDVQLEAGNRIGISANLRLASPAGDFSTPFPERFMGDMAVTAPIQDQCSPLADAAGDTAAAGIDIREVRVSDDGASLRAEVVLVDTIPSNGAKIRFEVDADCDTALQTCGTKTADVTLALETRRGAFLFSGPATRAEVFDAGRLNNAVRWEIPFAALEPRADSSDPNPSHICYFAQSELSSRRRMKQRDKAPDLAAGNTSGSPCLAQEFCRYTRSFAPTHLASVPIGAVIAVEEGTGLSRVVLANVGIRSLSDLALDPGGRFLYISAGFGQSGAGFAGDGRVGKIDLSTGGRVFLNPSGFSTVPALEFAADGTLYGIGGSGATGEDPDYSLIRINPDTGEGTPVGARLGVDFVDGLTITGSGRFLGAGFRGAQAVLTEIDPGSGAARILGGLGFDVAAGLEASRTSHYLVGALGGIDALGGGLIRINPNTVEAEFVGNTVYRAVSGLTELPPRR